jgi:hypothetical protein
MATDKGVVRSQDIKALFLGYEKQQAIDLKYSKNK